MATVSFTNNLGTIDFHQAMLSVVDDWQWDGARAQRRKTVRVNGTMIRRTLANTEGFEPIFAGAGTERGGAGPLTLPWTTLDNMKLQGIDLPGETWISHVPVTAEFVDDDPDRNEYEINFFGILLRNPRFTVELPHKSLRDEYVQMPLNGNIDDPAYGPIRTMLTQDNISCSLTGDWSLPEDLNLGQVIAQLSHRGGVGGVAITGLPVGYPAAFNVASFSSVLAAELPLRQLWVTGSQMDWDIPRDQARISIQMECLPQRWWTETP